MKKLVHILAILTALLLLVMPPLVQARPSMGRQGLEPLYESDWVECAGDGETQSFFHDLRAHVSMYTINVYEYEDPLTFYHGESQGTFYYDPTSTWYGHLNYRHGVSAYFFKVKWRKYIAVDGGHWIECDNEETRVQLVIWAADDLEEE